MRKVLILPAVDDQTVAFISQPKLVDETLRRADEISHEDGIVGIEGPKIREFQLRHQQNVDGIAGFGVLKGDQGIGFAQAFNRQHKTDLRKKNADDEFAKGSISEAVEGVHQMSNV